MQIRPPRFSFLTITDIIANTFEEKSYLSDLISDEEMTLLQQQKYEKFKKMILQFKIT